MEEQSHADVVEKLLALLREWGWEAGYKRLEARLPVADAGPAVRAFFLAWMAAERGAFPEADTHVREMESNPTLASWARFVEAFVALRQKEYAACDRLLDAAEDPLAGDSYLAAAIDHVRGTLRFHQGRPADGLPLLRQALGRLGGADSMQFGAGRVLDTLGMLYAGRDNFHAARAFYRRSMELKARHGDRAGEALTHGQLGRMYLDWGLWAKAEEHFERNRRLSQEIFDARGEAMMCGALGQVMLAQGRAREAAEWLDEAVRHCQDSSGGWPVVEGYARKDRALAFLARGGEADQGAAQGQLEVAGELFRRTAPPFAEGLAHVDRAWGELHRLRGQWGESRQRLRDALRYFQAAGVRVEVARTQMELARTQRAAGAAVAPARADLLTALATAEDCRRGHLVRVIEAELKAVDAETYYAHLYRRLRGGAADDDAASLMDGRSELVTVLFLDVKGSTELARDLEPTELMLTLNQLLAELVEVMRRHQVSVNVFRGDGFLALSRGEDHARRAVEAALDANEPIRRFNVPRETLGLKQIDTRIGISTGVACLGNVGTYDKLDFTALGTAVNLGARLEPAAVPGQPCISELTRKAVGDRFEYADPAGRTVRAKGFDSEEVRAWDVTGRKS